MKWVYSIVLLVLFAALAVAYIILIAHLGAAINVSPPTHPAIHSGIGNALCTPSSVCTREF